jgi:hypothetical protein
MAKVMDIFAVVFRKAATRLLRRAQHPIGREGERDRHFSSFFVTLLILALYYTIGKYS